MSEDSRDVDRVKGKRPDDFKQLSWQAQALFLLLLDGYTEATGIIVDDQPLAVVLGAIVKGPVLEIQPFAFELLAHGWIYSDGRSVRLNVERYSREEIGGRR